MGSKRYFADKVLYSFVNLSNVSNTTYENLVLRSKTLFGKMPLLMQPLPQLTEIEDINKLEEDVIWTKKIIGKADIGIAPLIEHLGISGGRD